MASFFATAVGLGFTLAVCLFVLRALLDPSLRIRRAPTVSTNDTGDKHTARASKARGAAPLHIA